MNMTLRTSHLLGALGALGLLVCAPACSKDSSADGKRDEAAKSAPTDTQTGAATGAAKVTAAPPTGAAEGTRYGDAITQAESIPIADLIADPDKYAGQQVRVEGTVADVCPKRGCWFEMAGEKPGEKMRFKVRDGVMTFPLDAKGKYAVAEGVVHTSKLSLEETREYLKYQAEEYGKDVDPQSVTEPMTIVRLDGKGAVIRDRK